MTIHRELDQREDPRLLTSDEIVLLVERHLALLRSYVRLRAGPLVRSKEPVSDVVQSTVREVFEAGSRLEFADEEAFRGWLYTVATHKIISKQRYYAAEMRDPGREEQLSRELWDLPEPDGSRPSRSPFELAAHREDLARLQSAFDALDEKDRQILALRKLFDVPASRIAAELGIAESTVRWRLGVILTELASRLG